MQVAKQHFLFLSCGYVVAEILPSDCGMAIMDIKKVARALLCISLIIDSAVSAAQG
jgi:hypothetical protein